MYKTARFAIGLVVFVASYVILTILLAPLLTQKGGSEPFDADAIGRLPVVIAEPEGPSASNPKYFVAQMRNSHDVTAKSASYTFLLPPGTNEIVDQDGDAATYTAENISTGRQRIHLECMVGGYRRDVEYEAEARKAFPLRDRHTGPHAAGRRGNPVREILDPRVTVDRCGRLTARSRDVPQAINLGYMLNAPARVAMSYPSLRRTDAAKKPPRLDQLPVAANLEKFFKEYRPQPADARR
jgi:hypothetical protein